MHQPYINVIPNSRNAVVFIHGFIGTPNHFQFLIDLVPATWSVYNILLDGHGGSVDEFSATSMKKWQQQVKQTIDNLQQHKNIYLVGHSMGCLLELQYVCMYPSQVKGLFLLAVPLRVHVTPLAIKNAIGTVFHFNDTHDKQLQAAKAMYGVETDPRIWKYIPWISRYFELFSLCKWVRKNLRQLSIPTICIQSKKDELVQFRSCRYLEKHKDIQLNILEHSTHYYYTDEEKENLCQIFLTFLNK